MPVRRQSIILLRGTAGVGKTAILHAMQAGQSHLLCEPFRPAVAEGFAAMEVNDVAAEAEQSGEWLAAARRAIGDAPWLIAEPCVHAEHFAAACADHFDLYHVWLFAPAWLLEARRQHRFATHSHFSKVPPERNSSAERIAGQYSRPDDVDYALALLPCAETLFIDTRDWPLRPMQPDEAKAMLATAEPGPPPPLTVSEQYQQWLHIRGEWHGTDKPWRQDFEQARLDLILPEDCTGLDVLDIGASDGGFCWEALSRGARQCMAVECRPDRIALMQDIRNRCQLPVTTATVNVVTDSLPQLHAHGEPQRYGLGLLLNVLHHLPNPDAVLRNVLRLCDRLIVETPFGIGLSPYKPALPPYPNATHLPPAWVQRVAEQEGFALAAMKCSNMTPGQRLVFDLVRQTDG